MATLLRLRAGAHTGVCGSAGASGEDVRAKGSVSGSGGGGALSQVERSGPGPPKSLASEDQPSTRCRGGQGVTGRCFGGSLWGVDTPPAPGPRESGTISILPVFTTPSASSLMDPRRPFCAPAGGRQGAGPSPEGRAACSKVPAPWVFPMTGGGTPGTSGSTSGGPWTPLSPPPTAGSLLSPRHLWVLFSFAGADSAWRWSP